MAYTIVTAAATSTDTDYNGHQRGRRSVTNTDNDTAGITVSPTSGLTTTEAGGTATFTVVLTSQPTANVTIGLASNDTTEGTVSPASVTFTTGNWNTPQTVTVTGVDDDLDDGDIGLHHRHRRRDQPRPQLQRAQRRRRRRSPTPTTTRPASRSHRPAAYDNRSGRTATFTVVLNTQPTADVTIGLSPATRREGTVSPASASRSPANWNTPQTVTVTGVNDDLDDGDVAYTIVTAAATSTDVNYNGLNAADVRSPTPTTTPPGSRSLRPAAW